MLFNETFYHDGNVCVCTVHIQTKSYWPYVPTEFLKLMQLRTEFLILTKF